MKIPTLSQAQVIEIRKQLFSTPRGKLKDGTKKRASVRERTSTAFPIRKEKSQALTVIGSGGIDNRPHRSRT
uniref:Expressed protein n=1 Tax=Echinococcus granulosus TaxID=6210 RepID=A0A068WHS2_ECHGR|nr:expressed protein [Echinococcus granulosus]